MESRDFIQYAFDGGAFRLCVSPGPKGRDIFALVVDTRVPRYASFAQLASTERYAAYHDGAYTVVVALRPVSHELFDQLRRKSWSEDALQQQLGAPSYRWHVHGVGYLGLTYVPQGLSFIGDPPGLNSPVTYQVDAPDIDFSLPSLPPLTSLSGLDYGKLQLDCRETFASEIFGERKEIGQALARGKRSPGGRFVASPVNIAGPWYMGEIVIRETGKPERRYAGASGTQDKDYFWLNSRVCVFKAYWAGGEAFYTIDATAGGPKVAAALPYENDPDPHHQATDVGVSGPQRFWYKTADGETHEVTVKP